MTSQPASHVRVLVISNEQPGTRMSGPAIRAVSIARELAEDGHAVLLAVPQEPDCDLGVPAVAFGKPSAATFRRLASGADLVLTQPQRVDVAAGLHRGGARVVYDLYVPALVEFPASLAGSPLSARARARAVDRNRTEYLTAVRCGDGFVVASQRQGDALHEQLAAAGRSGMSQPPVAVVPYGLPDALPEPAPSPVLRGVRVPQDSFIAIWAGGIWDWFDPLTVVRGVASARAADPRIRLVFLGAGHPDDRFHGAGAAGEFWQSPEVEQLTSVGGLIVVDRWVPYEERSGYLLEADVGVCAYYNSAETWLSFRTRLLDHLWTGLPSLLTDGGVLTELMVERGAAVAVPERAAEAWAGALLDLANNPDREARMSARAAELAGQFRWSRAVRPLLTLIPEVLDRVPSPPPSGVAVSRYLASVLWARLASASRAARPRD